MSVLFEKAMNFHCELNLEESRLITKILVGVDGSKNSEKALDYALEIADKFSASILILNVFQPPPESGYNVNVFSQFQTSGNFQDAISDQSNIFAFINDLRKVHEAVLSKAAERAIKLKPMLEITTELKEGNTPSQIIATAANSGFDLIVLGHLGESEIKEFLLGSTSERVVHQARCTVLIVK
jgi:nucleotide-binding universal stress UspA family protein